MAKKIRWEIALSRLEGEETTLMPDEVKVAGNSVRRIAGSGMSRIIELAEPVEKIAVESVKIQRPLQDYYDGPAMQVTGIRAL